MKISTKKNRNRHGACSDLKLKIFFCLYKAVVILDHNTT
jgi:hypothetical protein